MQKQLHRPFRYDFFSIWGNGFDHADEILQILRAEKYLKIIRIEYRRVKNMRRFVFELYACDTVPIEHLRAKLKYLFPVSPEILIVYAKNMAPKEEPTGFGAFRKVQCQYINRIKWEIRELYNPRKNGRRTEEHIIHASDYEEQVDYLLKMTGHPDGIRFLEGDSQGLPFEKPYHLKRPDTYIFKKLPLQALRATILRGTPNLRKMGVKHAILPIEETPHFRGLSGCNDYEEYIKRYRYIFLKEDHYPEKLYKLKELSVEQIKTFFPILVRAEGTHYRILDGVHRAAVTKYHNQPSIKCVEFVL